MGNPDGQDFLLRVALETPAGSSSRRWDIGVVNPFPPDVPATFVLSLPTDASDAIGSADGPSTLVIDLQPADSQPLVAPLEVQVSGGVLTLRPA